MNFNPLNTKLNPICPLLTLFELTLFLTLAGKWLSSKKNKHLDHINILTPMTHSNIQREQAN